MLKGEFDKDLFTFHSFRVTLATQLGAAHKTDSEIQAVCRWQTASSLLVYKRMQAETVCDMLDAAQAVVVTSYTAANLPTISSYDVARGIHAWNEGQGQGGGE